MAEKGARLNSSTVLAVSMKINRASILSFFRGLYSGGYEKGKDSDREEKTN